METKDTLSSCSYSDEQDMQQMLKQAKILKDYMLINNHSCIKRFRKVGDKKVADSRMSIVSKKGKALDAFQRQSKKEILHGNFYRKLHSQPSNASFTRQLKGTRESRSGFKRAFAPLFGQDVETFIGINDYLNMDHLEKQLDKERIQEIGIHGCF
ncbi:hypothetical protein Tco_0642176 [Tanacetum coccineum]